MGVLQETDHQDAFYSEKDYDSEGYYSENDDSSQFNNRPIRQPEVVSERDGSIDVKQTLHNFISAQFDSMNVRDKFDEGEILQ